MSEIPLPLDRFSGDTYLSVLKRLVDRYVEDGEPVHYKKTAIDLNKSTCSSCLKYFSEIDLIEADKAGVYVPSKPITNYFRKVRQSKQKAKNDIENILDEYKIFSEAIFLTQAGEFNLEELSTKIAGQLDIDKKKLSNISTAIEIFTSFGYLQIDDSNETVKPNISENDVGYGIKIEEKLGHSGSESKQSTQLEFEPLQSNQKSKQSQTDTTDVEFPPARGGPDKLLALVKALSQGGAYSIDQLIDEMDASKRSINGTAQYGISLGFVTREDDGFQLSEDGFELALISTSAEREHLFKQSIIRYESYRNILRESITELDGDNQNLNSKTLQKELRTTFSFTENKDSTLQEAITKLLKTVEAAGIGKYIVGRRGSQTRLELDSTELTALRSLVSNEQTDESGEANHSDKDIFTGNGSSPIPESNNSSVINSEQDTTADNNGPAVRISEFRIQNFRNIRDTGFIELEDVTTLIGKNESGKTSTLEAINSFSADYEYDEYDLANSADVSPDDQVPIVSLRFEIGESLVTEFYPDLLDDVSIPLTVTRTKYSDNSYEIRSPSTIDPEEIDLPTPHILYYDTYNTLSDSVTIEQLNNGNKETFKNLLEIGGLSVDDLEGSPLSLYNSIETAQNQIEDQLNNAWSQKSLNINLNWRESEESIHLLIQDKLDSGSAIDERPLTYPSQRSEGFQWFLSFYINLLAESNSEGLESKVLLLDDPAVYLHPEGKRDWLESVNEIGKNEQVVFSSHSPYLIDKRYPSRIRAVEDTPRGGTKIREDIFESDSHTLEPLRNALGVDLGSSPFVSRRQLLVEGPTEYYIVAAVANYFTQKLDRDLFGWQEVSVMPVRGASNVVGQASWLESEGIDYAILLDSDSAGLDALDRIDDHHPDINTDKVVLLQNTSSSENVVTEDLFDPKLYVSAFNEEYKHYTSELEDDFAPANVNEASGYGWKVEEIEYDGTRLDKVLIQYLESLDISKEIQNSRGDIELRKRQIAERIASRLNRGDVKEEQLESFNRLFAEIDSAMG